VHQLGICIKRQITGLHKASYFISIQFFISLIAQYLLKYIFLKLLSYIIRQRIKMQQMQHFKIHPQSIKFKINQEKQIKKLN
jgi:hypothetical protein